MLQEIECAFDNLPSKYFAGIDGIPCNLIKHCKSSLSLPIYLIINKSIATGEYPSCWKEAKIVPVHKSGGKNIVSNYRPILSGFSKIFKICLYDRVYGLFKSIVIDEQHGFLPGRSTTTNLLALNQYLFNSISRGHQVHLIYIDSSKAFDKLNIALLINKFKALGLSDRMMKLLALYLCNRKSFVTYNGFLSTPFTPTSGVPQGSNLGPLLFLIFINDVILHIKSPILLYADDAKIFRAIETDNHITLLQHDLDRFHLWCRKNELMLNIKKCKAITFHKYEQMRDMGHLRNLRIKQWIYIIIPSKNVKFILSSISVRIATIDFLRIFSGWANSVEIWNNTE